MFRGRTDSREELIAALRDEINYLRSRVSQLEGQIDELRREQWSRDKRLFDEALRKNGNRPVEPAEEESLVTFNQPALTPLEAEMKKNWISDYLQFQREHGRHATVEEAEAKYHDFLDGKYLPNLEEFR